MLTDEIGFGTDWITKLVYRFGSTMAEAFYRPAFERDRQMRWPTNPLGIGTDIK